MTCSDLWRLSLENLWRTKLRSILTTLGVVIGIGALVSMVAFGVGMQENVTREFRENDLFTSMQVLPSQIDLSQLTAGEIDVPEAVGALSDSAVGAIRGLPGVEVAFPEISFPVTVRLLDKEAKTTLRGMPAEMGRFKPWSDLSHGRFFSSDADSSIVLSRRLLRSLGFVVAEEPDEYSPPVETGEGEGLVAVAAESILGRRVEVVSSVLDVQSVARSIMRTFTPPSRIPLKDEVARLTVVGIHGRETGFSGVGFRGGAVVPIETGARMPRLGFSTVWELLDRKGDEEGYASVYVRTTDVSEISSVRESVEEMGFGVVALADEFEEIKRAFLIMDAFLGTVGTIALIVASLGIINTMVTSILERTREIGVMKALGGSEMEIKWIFFSEAATIGFVGGVLGLALGWIVTRIANAVANHYMGAQGVPHVELFHIPAWLILGAVGFSISVSLLAGVYPAARAAAVDPVQALRHD